MCILVSYSGKSVLIEAETRKPFHRSLGFKPQRFQTPRRDHRLKKPIVCITAAFVGEQQKGESRDLTVSAAPLQTPGLLGAGCPNSRPLGYRTQIGYKVTKA